MAKISKNGWISHIAMSLELLLVQSRLLAQWMQNTHFSIIISYIIYT